MTQIPTHRGSTIAHYMVNLFEANKGLIGASHGLTLKSVRYGDEVTHANVPVLCIEPALVERELRGAPFQFSNTIATQLIVYHTGKDGVEQIQKQLDILCDDIAEFLNMQSVSQVYGGNQLDGLVTHGVVTRQENGYRVLNDRLMRCNRLIWTGFNVTRQAEALNSV